MRCLFAVLPGAILWGASFPLALASVASPTRIPRAAGRRRVRRQHARRDRRLARREPRADGRGSAASTRSRCSSSWPRCPGCCCSGDEKVSTSRPSSARRLAASLLVLTVHPIPGILVAYGRYLGDASSARPTSSTSAKDGMPRSPCPDASNGVLNYHNAGKVQASSEPQDMRLQRMLGHLTTLVPASAKTVLVIGCGAGVTAGAVSIDPAVEHETIAEIEPLVPRVVSTYFAEHNFDVVRNPKVRVQIDDARHFLFTTRREVRRDHVGSARSVGQGRRDAVHAGVLRARQAAPESRRRRHAVRAALREQHRGGEERDRDVLRGVSERDDLRQHLERPGLRPGPARAGRADAHQSRRDRRAGSSGPSTRR